MKKNLATVLMLAALAAGAAGLDSFKPAGPNVAAGCKYELTPKPNYKLCSDPDDNIQLTDGVYTQGYFWTQKSTVGWNGDNVDITIDLGREENICGASLNSAGGIANVSFPSTICMFTSLDKKIWSLAGDIVQLGTVDEAPSPDKYSIFRYATNALSTRGRYVKFFIFGKKYFFTDEIEIYAGGNGDKAVFDITDTKAKAMSYANITGSNTRLRTDLNNMKQSLIDNGLFGGKLEADFSRLDTALRNNPLVCDDDFKAILPFCDIHEKILAMNAGILAKKGYTKPFLWKNNRWKNLGITEIPPAVLSEDITVEMMRNEIRGETLNICNPTTEKRQAIITVDGIPENANLIINQVLFTDTQTQKLIADALVPSSVKDKIAVTLYAGCNAQIWFSFKRPVCKAGDYTGNITMQIDGKTAAKASLKLKVYDLAFPNSPTMHVGGWDYTNTMGNYYKTPDCVNESIAFMRDSYVDSPWGTNAVMPTGDRYDQEGHLLNPKDMNFKAWDKWTEMWKGSRRYCVFWSIGKAFRGVPPTDKRFINMLTEYINAWMAYVKSTGFNPKNVVVLLFDEPSTPEQAQHVVEWSRPIKERCPEFTLFQDPTFNDPRPVDPEFFKVNDILCPNTPMMHRNWTYEKKDPNFDGNFRDFYVQKRKEGAELWLYSCSGPSRTLDPVTYHRGQFWRAVDTGAVASMYWAFGCGGGIGNSWQPYSQSSPEYSPYFVGKTDCTNAKHNEGIREGVQDYEYFMMLNNKIAKLKADGKTKEAQAAQAVYDKALEDGLSTLPHLKENSMEWDNDNKHALMDDARIAILRELAK